MTDEDASAGGAAPEESPDDAEPSAGDAADPPTDDDAEAAGTDDVDEAALDPTGTTLLAEVAIEDESLAADLEEHLLSLAAERDEAAARAEEAEERAGELESKLKRKQADFENYKKRAKRREADVRERATADLVERLLEVRDDLVRALEDDHDDVESLREGVKLTLGEFDRVLDAEGVSEIAPEPGDEVDPQRHEVMLRVESDQPADAVAEVHRSGFEMDGTVIRPARVTVSEGPDGGDGERVDDGDADADDGDADAGAADEGGDESAE